MLVDIKEQINQVTEEMTIQGDPRRLIQEMAVVFARRYVESLLPKENVPPRDIAIVSVYMSCTKMGLRKELYESIVPLRDVGALQNIYQDMELRLNSR